MNNLCSTNACDTMKDEWFTALEESRNTVPRASGEVYYDDLIRNALADNDLHWPPACPDVQDVVSEHAEIIALEVSREIGRVLIGQEVFA